MALSRLFTRTPPKAQKKLHNDMIIHHRVSLFNLGDDGREACCRNHQEFRACRPCERARGQAPAAGSSRRSAIWGGDAMPAHLLIRDGSPQWWLSPDIWVVPGNDPNGLPGNPIAGQPAYLWAHVANTGDVAASGTRIDFYWADPAMQIMVGSATQIGSAYADVPAGGSQDVLCLVPWTPSIVNGGHECVLAAAHNPAEQTPLPDPLPNGFDFNPPAYDEIAQRNLSVVATDRRGFYAIIRYITWKGAAQPILAMMTR
jgi:hypothetical protein